MACPRLDWIESSTGGVTSLRYLSDVHRVIVHCSRHKDCRRSKMFRRGAKLGSGRPLGLVCAWAGAASKFATRGAHMDVDTKSFLRADRRVFRDELHTRLGSEFFFTQEAPKVHVDDDSEAEVVT